MRETTGYASRFLSFLISIFFMLSNKVIIANNLKVDVAFLMTEMFPIFKIPSRFILNKDYTFFQARNHWICMQVPSVFQFKFFIYYCILCNVIIDSKKLVSFFKYQSQKIIYLCGNTSYRLPFSLIVIQRSSSTVFSLTYSSALLWFCWFPIYFSKILHPFSFIEH